MKILFIILLIPIAIALFWNQVPIIKESVHAVFDPSLGYLLDYNLNIGMTIITGVVMLLTTIVQKYTVDNETLKQLKADQKTIQNDMKSLKENPEKLIELQKQSLAKAGEIMSLSLKSSIYTIIPFILLIRWFGDYFSAFETPVRIFGFFSWFWAYFVLAIIFSMIFRKLLKLP